MRDAPQAVSERATEPINLSRVGARTHSRMPASRRGAFIITALGICAIITGFGLIALFQIQGQRDAAATAPIRIALKPSSPAAPLPTAPARARAVVSEVPLTTGTVSPDAARTRLSDDLPLRRFDGALPQEGASAAVERAALMSARAAIAGLASGHSIVDRPTVMDGGVPPLRLASLASPSHLPALAEPSRPAGKTEIDSQSSTNTILVAEGDTLYDILETHGVSTTKAVGLARALADVFPPQDLRAGQELTLINGRDKDGRQSVHSMVLMTREGEFEVTRRADGGYSARTRTVAESDLEYRRALAGIKGSLYGTARAQGVPDSIIVRMMRTHSYDVDFQREIHTGDLFEVFYATGSAEADDSAARGQLLYSSLSTNGKTRSYYRYTTEDGTTDYYDETGVSSRKPLMKTPINGARISSGFGMRRHPILGYTKMHGGTDFAAPTGTPILAAGDGLVESAGRNGGYGNYVKLKHKSDLRTAYAHLSRFAKGIRAGKRVRQGDVIGYVGSTGNSTGPHLHYEVHINGKKQNPLTVKVAGGGRRLEGAELAAFDAERKRVDDLRGNVPVEALVAAARP